MSLVSPCLWKPSENFVLICYLAASGNSCGIFVQSSLFILTMNGYACLSILLKGLPVGKM